MKRLFHSLSKTSDGAFIIDSEHRIVFWNQAAEQLLGFSAEEIIGRQCYEILGGKDKDGKTLCQRFCLIAVKASHDDILPNQDIFTHNRKGEGRWLNVTTFNYPVQRGNVESVIVHLFRDITGKKNNERFVKQVLAASKNLQGNDDQQNDLTHSNNSPRARLTNRENQVLKLLAHGMSTDGIADTLVISPATVRNHIQNIFNKLKVHSRSEAIVYAYQEGLIKIEN